MCILIRQRPVLLTLHLPSWLQQQVPLTHWGRVTHICVGKLTIIGSNNGLSPSRRQATIWTNAGIMLIGPLGTNFSEILSEIHAFSFNKMHLKVSSAKWRLFCLGLNELTVRVLVTILYVDLNLQYCVPQPLSSCFDSNAFVDEIESKRRVNIWIAVGQFTSILIHEDASRNIVCEYSRFTPISPLVVSSPNTVY